jgi:hypothetical protein
MKLLPLLLLSATALATAVPAALDVALDARVSYEELKIITTREETKRMDVNDLPSPDTPIAFEITVDFDSYPDIAMPPEITKGFWDFDVVFTEYWIGPMLHSHGTFKTRYGDYDLDYEGEDNYTWIKLNDKYLQIIWNWVEHSKSRSPLSCTRMLMSEGRGSSLATRCGLWIYTVTPKT